MGIGMQSLKGIDKTNFKNIVENATGEDREKLEKKLARITNEAIAEAGENTAKRIRDKIAEKIKNRILEE